MCNILLYDPQIVSVNVYHNMLYARYIYSYSHLDVGQTIGFPKSLENAPRFGLYPNLRHIASHEDACTLAMLKNS